jgi:hypothetical protein
MMLLFFFPALYANVGARVFGAPATNNLEHFVRSGFSLDIISREFTVPEDLG